MITYENGGLFHCTKQISIGGVIYDYDIDSDGNVDNVWQFMELITNREIIKEVKRLVDK